LRNLFAQDRGSLPLMKLSGAFGPPHQLSKHLLTDCGYFEHELRVRVSDGVLTPKIFGWSGYILVHTCLRSVRNGTTSLELHPLGGAMGVPGPYPGHVNTFENLGKWMLCGRQTPERMFDGFLTSVRGTPSDRSDTEPQTAGGSQRQHRHYGRNCVVRISSV